MTETPAVVMTLDWEGADELVEVLWTGPNGDLGTWVSLLSGLPFVAYAIVTHDDPFEPGQVVVEDDLLSAPFGAGITVIELDRKQAGQLALALIGAVVVNGEEFIRHLQGIDRK